MISAATTVHQTGHGAEVRHSPQGRGRIDRLRMAPHGLQAGGWSATPAGHAIAFGPFRLFPTRRLLLEGEKPVRLGSRAFDILLALVERAGDLVSKDELMARVWPNTFVEESNLKVQVAGLRRALGDRRGSNRYLATISGRGYRFVAPVMFAEGLATRAERAHNLPVPIARMIDRTDAVMALMAQLSRHRLVTIVGPGGIGKTTIALAVARGMIGAYEDGVGFVDMAPLKDAHLAPNALAAALGLETCSEHPIANLIGALRHKRMLLVLDNCEHLIEASAAWAVEILTGAPGIRILATSRDPLRAEGERVHRLPPLETPPRSAGLSAAAALAFPAVQLFVERAAASLGGFELGDADAPLVGDICRRLAGVPLAIELAAARIDAFGLSGLAAHLDDALQLLTGGRRPAWPRHHSLRANLDWGHDLLREDERVVLRRLAIFVRGFTLEAASAVAAGGGVAAAEVVACVANLVAKSLIAADVGGTVPRYRLLETTRAYALEKLAASGEFEAVKNCYTGYLQDMAERTAAACHDATPSAWRSVAESMPPSALGPHSYTCGRAAETVWPAWPQVPVENIP
jgi:predicted ATPase/DNA-binding winged helix-turn-helix (wHTH) protein